MGDLPRFSDEQIILEALDKYAWFAETEAEHRPEGSRPWAEWVRRAQRANQLYVEHSESLNKRETHRGR